MNASNEIPEPLLKKARLGGSNKGENAAYECGTASPGNQQAHQAEHVEEGRGVAPAEPDSWNANVSKEEHNATEKWEMAPWEQHSAVINMPRFDYKGEESLFEGRAGFLITCGFRREKSATNEAMAVLPEYLCQHQPQVQAECHVKAVAKQGEESAAGGFVKEGVDKKLPADNSDRKFCTGDGGLSTIHANESENFSLSAEVVVEERLSAECVSVEAGRQAEDGNSLADKAKERSILGLSLVKLGSMGVAFISLSKEYTGRGPVEVVRSLLEDICSGSRKPLQWCARIVPVQATCPPSTSALKPLVCSLMRTYLEAYREPAHSDKPLKFAVAYKKRGPEADSSQKGSQVLLHAEGEKELGVKGGNEVRGSCLAELERGECIASVAEAVKEAAGQRGTQVDLNQPEAVVVIEVLPLRHGKLVCAAAVLPHAMMDMKPRMAIKSLSRPPGKAGGGGSKGRRRGRPTKQSYSR